MLHNAASDSSYSHSNRDSRFFRSAIICATGISMWLERTWHWSIGGVSLAWLPEQPERSQYLDSVAECVERITRCAPVPDFLSGSAGSLREKSATSSTCVSRAKCPVSRVALEANPNAAADTAAAYHPAMHFRREAELTWGWNRRFGPQKFGPVVVASLGRGQAIRNSIRLPSSLSCVRSATGPLSPVIRKLIAHKKHSTPVPRFLSSIK